jgi:hypothetical protein
MFSLADELGRGLDFVRVDMYNLGGRMFLASSPTIPMLAWPGSTRRSSTSITAANGVGRPITVKQASDNVRSECPGAW